MAIRKGLAGKIPPPGKLLLERFALQTRFCDQYRQVLFPNVFIQNSQQNSDGKKSDILPFVVVPAVLMVFLFSSMVVVSNQKYD